MPFKAPMVMPERRQIRFSPGMFISLAPYRSGLAVDSEIRMPSVMPEDYQENPVTIHFVEQVIGKLPQIRPAKAAGIEMVSSGMTLDGGKD